MGQCSHAPGHVDEVVIDNNIDGEAPMDIDAGAMETAMEQGGDVMTYTGYQAGPVATVSAAPPVDGSVVGVTVGAGSVVSVPVDGSVAAVPVTNQHEIYDASKHGQFFESAEEARKAAEAGNVEPHVETHNMQPLMYSPQMHSQAQPHMQPHHFQTAMQPVVHMPYHQYMAPTQPQHDVVMNNDFQQNNEFQQPVAEVVQNEAVVEELAVEQAQPQTEAPTTDADGVAPEVEDVEVVDDDEKVTEEVVTSTESKPKKKKRFGWF